MNIAALRSPAAARLLPRTVRVRLTLLYGTLFAASGAVLLTITYLLVRHNSGDRVVFRLGSVNVRPGDGRVMRRELTGPPDLNDPFLRSAREFAERQREAQLHEMLVQSGFALAIMVVISIVLGWLVAGRVLRPLRTMTVSVQRISARNVHERLAIPGPRDELKDLADTVDGLLGRLEAALQAQKRFVANAAHELRTPLTLERALLEETLTERDATVTSFRSTFERLLSLSDEQGRLLEALLTLAGSERGLDRREPVDLAELTEHVLLAARPKLDDLDLRMESGVRPATTAGAPALVERLVANLVDNAVRYNVPGGRVEVHTATEHGRAVVTVANTGPVVPPEQVDRLFEPFQRLDRTARDDDHHGLGLSIVRAIATAHDADLKAHARPAGGLLVEVAFPTGTPAAAPELEAPARR